MQLLSARQAWHDCFYKQADSTLQSSIEQATLGILNRPSGAMSGDWKKTKVGAGADFGGHRDDSGMMKHRATAGIVQSAIGTLPEFLQHFGHVMYAPISFVCADYVEDVVLHVARHVLLFKQPLHAEVEAIEALTLAQILRHRALMTRQPDPFPTIKALREFCWDEKGVQIDARNFSRTWDSKIELIRARIDRLDVFALWPVAEAIKLHDEISERSKKFYDPENNEEAWRELFKRSRERYAGLRY